MDFLDTPVNPLLSSQKCQGVPFFQICQKSLLLQRPHECWPHSSATKRLGGQPPPKKTERQRRTLAIATARKDLLKFLPTGRQILMCPRYISFLLYIHMYVYVYVCIYIYTHIPMCIWTCMRLCVCIAGSVRISLSFQPTFHNFTSK